MRTEPARRHSFRLLASAVTLTAALWGGAALTQSQPASEVKPNIVFILMDNLGYGEVGAYGGGISAARRRPASTSSRPRARGSPTSTSRRNARRAARRFMTGRFSIRSGTHSVPIGGGLEGLTQWEVTIAETAFRRRLRHRPLRQVAPRQRPGPTAQRPGLRRVVRHPAHDGRGLLAFGARGQGGGRRRSRTSWKAARARRAASSPCYDLEQRRLIDAEITRRTIDFMKRSVAVGQAVLRLCAVHAGALPDAAEPDSSRARPATATSPTRSPRWTRTSGEILDAVDELRIRDNTIVVFTSDNGPEATWPWQGSSGPWRGYYFTHMEGSLRDAVHHPLAGPDSRRPREQRDRARGRHLHHLRQDRRRRGAAGPPDRRRGPDRFPARQVGQVEPRRLPGVRGRPPGGGEMAELEDRLLRRAARLVDPARQARHSRRHSTSSPIRRRNTRRRPSGTPGLRVRPSRSSPSSSKA